MLVAVAALKQVPLTDAQAEQLTTVELTLNLLPGEERVNRPADMLRDIALSVLREAIVREVCDLAPRFRVHDVLFGFIDIQDILFVENTKTAIGKSYQVDTYNLCESDAALFENLSHDTIVVDPLVETLTHRDSPHRAPPNVVVSSFLRYAFKDDLDVREKYGYVTVTLRGRGRVTLVPSSSGSRNHTYGVVNMRLGRYNAVTKAVRNVEHRRYSVNRLIEVVSDTEEFLRSVEPVGEFTPRLFVNKNTLEDNVPYVMNISKAEVETVVSLNKRGVATVVAVHPDKDAWLVIRCTGVFWRPYKKRNKMKDGVFFILYDGKSWLPASPRSRWRQPTVEYTVPDTILTDDRFYNNATNVMTTLNHEVLKEAAMIFAQKQA